MDTTQGATGASLNLEQLKKQAKDLLSAVRNGDAPAIDRVVAGSHRLREIARDQVPMTARLHDAQFALAQEHGFTSWPRLKEHIEDLARDRTQRIDALIEASLPIIGGADHRHGDVKRARRLLDLDPSLATATIATACVVGDVAAVEGFIARDPALATAPTGPRHWTPLLHTCFSRFLRIETDRATDFVAIATRLLDAGANPNDAWGEDGAEHGDETALYGAAGVARCTPLTELLLARGADPNDGVSEDILGSESIYHASESSDLGSLRAILAAKPRANAVSYCLARKLDFEDPDGARLMIEHGADVNFVTPFGDRETRLHHAIRRGRGIPVLQVLVDAGADLTARNAHGQTPFALASRLGRADVAAWLLQQGSVDDLDTRTRFVAAAARADRDAALALLDAEPNLIESLDAEDKRALPLVTARGKRDPVEVMLDVGFPIDAIGDPVGAALHAAGWEGHAEIADLLIARGANLQLLNHYGGTPFGAAVHACSFGPPCEPATRERIVRALGEAMLKANLDPNLSGYLRASVHHGTPGVARLLIDLGADLDARKEPTSPSARDMIEQSGDPDFHALL